MTMRSFFLALTFLLTFSGVALAVNPGEQLADPALEARARTISKELRCLVCQNQSIDDSDADLAQDLRLLVRERLMAGDSDQQVLDYITARYGDFVLLRPPFETATWLLWLAPFAVILIGGCGIFLAIRRNKTDAGPEDARQALDSEEQSKLDRILDENR
tara:strand:- start:178533 stop:179012 length:480 start_codon:yes stop_codon:yes gene_type:complete